jgi:predicted transcriptional regulator
MSDGDDVPPKSSDSPSDGSLSLDEMFDLLADRHRRYLFEYLAKEADPTVPLDDAVSYVTDQLAEETDYRPTDEDVKGQLHHAHIPRLADSGLVEFDERSETIRYHVNERLEAFHKYIQTFPPE